MNPNMILSASGWRKVFAVSGNEQDPTEDISQESEAISIISALIFVDYIKEVSKQSNPVIAIGMDTRPTGPRIVNAMLHALVKKEAIIQFTGITSAPEIMAFSRNLDGFIYISASHNPIGHNGIKFGTNDGGVLNGTENAKLVAKFNEIISDDNKVQELVNYAYSCSNSALKDVYGSCESSKFNAINAYRNFINETITGTNNKEYQTDFFGMLNTYVKENPIGVVCDFNGSSRAKCIDKEYFTHNYINFYSINDNHIVHEIIPEAENLVHCANEMERLQKAGYKDAILGYMPDCDGDRGNIVYWDNEQEKAVILKAQEVFSLSVLAELTYSIWQHGNEDDFKPAVVVNCPTSMRIDEICEKLGAKVFRAEVGEANVVNLARIKRDEGYTVRILGEGSNGGTITYPASVRDPLNTIFAIIKLLLLKDDGLFKLWCTKAGLTYKENFTLTDILKTLPVYTTTGVSEPEAILHIKTMDHSILKSKFQKIFSTEWELKKEELKNKFDISNYIAIKTNGTIEEFDIKDYSTSHKGGLKILFRDSSNKPLAYMWMRGSGTEPVFRILCDVKGDNKEEEKFLLKWETELLQKSDS